ncbi:MAG: hypothetical protein ACRCV3_05360 [Desulfovibrionaceae bacterium]
MHRLLPHTFEDWELFLKDYSHSCLLDTKIHYETVPKELRAAFKEHIAFLYAIYQEEHCSIISSTSIYSSISLKKVYNKIEYFSLFLPSIFSIPIILSLLVPAQILRIPSQLFFTENTKIPSPLHTALELLGIEEIYIVPQKEYDTIFNKTKNNYTSRNITSGTLYSPHSIWHYAAPTIYTPVTSEIYTIFYPDAHFETLPQKRYYDACFGNKIENNIASQYLEMKKEHLWLFPKLSLLHYYTIQTYLS